MEMQRIKLFESLMCRNQFASKLEEKYHFPIQNLDEKPIEWKNVLNIQMLFGIHGTDTKILSDKFAVFVFFVPILLKGRHHMSIDNVSMSFVRELLPQEWRIWNTK